MSTLISEDKIYDFKTALDVMKQKISAVFRLDAEKLSTPKIVRIKLPITGCIPLNWLSQQSNDTKIYWTDRNNQINFAGLGTAHTINTKSWKDAVTQIQEHLFPENSTIKYYGGACFDHNNHNNEWNHFGAYQFVLPRFEVFSDNGTAFLACNIFLEPHNPELEQNILSEVRQINTQTEPIPAAIPKPISRQDDPNKEEWTAAIQKTIKDIQAKQYSKIVLARRSTFQFSTPLNPYTIIQKLEKLTTNCYIFLFQFAANNIFLGASPERLYKREGRTIATEALAGTRPRGQSDDEDQKFISELAQSKKDAHEHELVVQMIQDQLKNLCKPIQFDDQPSLLHLTGGHHLISHYKGELLPDITDLEILSSLHPTPAVAGYPKKRSIEKIKSIEPFSRGWYAGPVGYIGQHSCDFAVAIRSGLIKNNSLNLYSGAGIVASSNPNQEWDEIEHKLSSFVKIFE